jgi:predicted small lipoprotein YifL
MTRFTSRTLCACLLAAVTGCGEAPPADAPPTDTSAPGAALQQVSFTGIGDPATGRLQIIMGPQAAIGQVPQAAIGQIPEDSDGNAGTVAANKVQVYGPAVSFVAQGGTGYPSTCTGPQAMVANVELYSGFKEQLRNVYARITSKSTGPTFCTVATPGAVAPPGAPYVGLYSYGPLDGSAAGALKRSVQWSLNLPDQSPFWFSGDVWAEVIPAAPVIGTTTATNNPADGTTIHTGGSGSSRQNFTWTNDPRADGQNTGENYAVARPTGGALLTIWSCGSAGTAAAPVTFNSANCRTYVVSPRLFNQYTTAYNRRFSAGVWYQWSLQSYFLLPGSTTRIGGSTIQTRHFAVISP